MTIAVHLSDQGKTNYALIRGWRDANEEGAAIT